MRIHRKLDATATVLLVYMAGIASGYIIFSALGGLGEMISAITDALK